MDRKDGLDYAVVDVFAERALEGNMLAIFTDANGLTGEEMQALARETNLSETTFILPRDVAVEKTEGVRVRIFTVEEELPFAGHPTLGTASWLWHEHPVFKGAEEIVLDLKVGKIPVRFQPSKPDELGVFGEMRQKDPVFGAVHDAAAVTAALGLTMDDLLPGAVVQTVSTGMAFCIVPFRSLERLSGWRMPQEQALRYLAESDAKFFYCIAPVPDRRAAAGSGADWRARMQWPSGEDPATGSAAGCCISYLVRHGLAESGKEVIIEQGIEIHRPSRIHVSALKTGENEDDRGRITEVRVGGRTIPVAKGRFFQR